MPTYIKDIDYSIHTITSVTHQLKVIEEPDIPNSGSKLTVSIIRNNSSNIAEGGREHLTIKINGEKVCDEQNYTFRPPANGSDEVFIRTYTIPHTFTGANNFTVSVTYKCDKFETVGNTDIGNLLPNIYYTIGTATITGTLTPVDQSSPQISGLTVKADRYGINASASFTALHTSYNLTSIVFKLSGLTSSQAYGRYAKATQADESNYSRTTDGKYELKLSKYKDLTNSISINFDLDDRFDNERPLDSGGSYPWELTVTAYNGKSTTISGVLNVPQKVTGVSCEERLDINPGQKIALDYSVTPANAELMDVTFTSSNSEIATVDGSGNVTGITEGPCTITVKTADGGFNASCLVYVLDSSVYPILEPLERYFRASHLNRMILATQFIKLEIEEMSGEVPDFEIIYFSGRAEKVVNIFPILQSFYANCVRLKATAEALGVSVEGLPEIREIIKINAGWQLVLNEWIAFLNKLHEKINGG